jgi:hypothetical protein
MACDQTRATRVRKPVRRLDWLLALIAVLAALSLPTSAFAHHSAKKAIWGPVRVNGVSQFPTYRDLGATIYLTKLNWNSVAPVRPARPADPADAAYRWPAELDDAMAQAAIYGMRVALEVNGAPGWASGHRDPIWAPRQPADYANFVRAAARRYPHVHLWLIWGEPTQRQNFQPLLDEVRLRPLTREMRIGPHVYARILDAAYGTLKRQSRRNLVIGGNSFTTGDVSPTNWVKNLRLRSGLPPRMDLYGHNPFTNRKPLFGRPPSGFGFADFSDLPRFSRLVDRYLARPRHKSHLKFFLSELFWPTDHANHEFNYWLTQPTAARWLTIALRTTERWNRIYALGWFSLYDDPPDGNRDEVNRGLLTWTGLKKPAFDAYRRG